MKYLVHITYSDDTERKRAEYYLETKRGRLKISRPEGSMLIIEAEEKSIGDFLEGLLERVDPSHVEVYRLEEPDFRIGEKRVVLDLHTRMPVEELKGAVNLLMARMRGILTSSGDNHRVYIVRPRGSTARVHFHFNSDDPDGARARIIIEGFGRSVEKVARIIEDEISLLGEVKNAPESRRV